MAAGTLKWDAFGLCVSGVKSVWCWPLEIVRVEGRDTLQQPRVNNDAAAVGTLCRVVAFYRQRPGHGSRQRQ